MNRYLIVLVTLALLFGCSKKNANDETTSNNLNAKATAILQTKAEAVVSEALKKSLAETKSLNTVELTTQLKNIEGIKTVEFTPSGVGINVVTTSGENFILSLSCPDNEAAFSLTDTKAEGVKINALTALTTTPVPKPITANNLVPTNKKALILLPFNRIFFQQQIGGIVAFALKEAGYDLTVLYDEQVTLDVLKGDFLQQYGVIYISTHGLANVKIGSSTSTVIMTGQKYDPEHPDPLRLDLLPYIQAFQPEGDAYKSKYYCVSVPYLERTLTQKFKNTWVFMGACESAKNRDLADFFLNNGAMGYNGFDGEVKTGFCETIGAELTALLAQGHDFVEASNSVKYNHGIYETWISKITSGRININSFVYYTPTTRPFTIVDQVKGYGVLSSTHGNIGNTVQILAYINSPEVVKTWYVDHSYFSGTNDSLITPTIASGPYYINNLTVKYPGPKYRPWANFYQINAVNKQGFTVTRFFLPYTVH